MQLETSIAVGAVVAALASWAQAAATPDELKQLGTTLTPWGAEKAGNKDGTIPPYTGGLTTPPEGFDIKSGKWNDPYASDKPLYSITAANMAQYADKLTPGTQELLKRWPTYRVDVYPTRRGYWSAKESQDNAIKNAGNPDCKVDEDGDDLEGCWAGTPFPTPKTGHEAMWNHLVRERAASQSRSDHWLVNAAGVRTRLLTTEMNSELPYWNTKLAPHSGMGAFSQRVASHSVWPARDAGNVTLIWYPLHFSETDQRAWIYSQGQRRVRLAPEFSYDTPIASVGGAIFYDEAALFAGRMDRHDYKLVGKKEMIIPYNGYRAIGTTNAEQLLGQQHVNPDLMRWELRRVWVVEATSKAGKRHAAARRTFFIEEDSWTLMTTDAYDQSNKIFRVGFANAAPNYATGGILDFSFSTQTYDLSRGQYLYASCFVNPQSYFKVGVPPFPASQFSPDAIAGRGVR